MTNSTIQWQWEGSENHPDGTAIFFPNTDYTFKIRCASFEQAHNISRQLSLRESHVRSATLNSIKTRIQSIHVAEI